jgi:hypothetical protein
MGFLGSLKGAMVPRPCLPHQRLATHRRAWSPSAMRMAPSAARQEHTLRVDRSSQARYALERSKALFSNQQVDLRLQAAGFGQVAVALCFVA